ncbi:DUF1631 domain-containing protein [Polaromonas sp. P1(28)-8]|nr:DUF1631 domain-containing protein [Polaromonas sp. P1(28)-8]
MGSCVLGFDVTVSGGAMEAEIRRVVQVIEQYPETGRRVFQLVYDEFEKFLSKFLSEQGSAARGERSPAGRAKRDHGHPVHH